MLDRWLMRLAGCLLHRAVAVGWRDRPTLQRDLSILSVLTTLVWSWRSVVEGAYPHPLFLAFPFASVVVAAMNVRSYAMVAGIETTPYGREVGRLAASIWRDRTSARLVLAIITVSMAFTTSWMVGIWIEGDAPFFPVASVTAVLYFSIATVVGYLNAVGPFEEPAPFNDAIHP